MKKEKNQKRKQQTAYVHGGENRNMRQNTEVH